MAAIFLLEAYMRTVKIDLSTDNGGSGEKIYVGYTGEHNATELVVKIPPEMAAESDCLVAVFLTGEKIIRSRKITAQRDLGLPYLDGNEVHISLSQKLTGNTSLGIQIEGYVKDENGISTLVGKSAYISNLTFRLSPKGTSEDSVMPDYEEIVEMIRKASENTKSSGIKKYETFDLLTSEAEDGDLAYVKTESGTVITEPFEFDKKYARFIQKREIVKDALKSLLSDENDNEMPASIMSAEFRTATAEREELCYCFLLYYEPIGSILVFSELSCKDHLYDYDILEDFFIYISGEGDMSPLLDTDKPVIVTPGWYKMIEKPGKWYLDGSSPEREWSYEFEPIDFEDTPVLKLLKNCVVKYDSENEYENVPEMASIFARCFDIYSEPFHEKGLYLYKDGAWERTPNFKFIAVPSRADLCFTAEEGQTAVVEDDTDIFNDSGNYIYTGMHFRDLYINPKPPEYMWLTDCRIKAALCYTDPSTGTVVSDSDGGKGFDVISDKNRKYVFFGLNVSPYDSFKRYYLYTEKAGDITLPAGMFDQVTVTVIKDAPKGWSKVNESNGTYTATPLNDYMDLPRISLSGYTDHEYYFNITEYECGISSQSFIGTNTFYRSDNAKGLWYFSLGRWRKVGDTDA